MEGKVVVEVGVESSANSQTREKRNVCSRISNPPARTPLAKTMRTRKTSLWSYLAKDEGAACGQRRAIKFAFIGKARFPAVGKTRGATSVEPITDRRSGNARQQE